MPTFDTPRPILVDLELGVGDVRITAGDRTDTTVEVRPTDPSKPSDVDGCRADARRVCRRTAADQGTKELATLHDPRWRRVRSMCRSRFPPARGPRRRRRRRSPCHRTARRMRVQDRCRRHPGRAGGPVHLSTGVGDIAVQRVSGHAEITTGSGSVRLGTVDGTAVVKGANGDTWIGTISRDLRVASANGSILVDHSNDERRGEDRQRGCAPRRRRRAAASWRTRPSARSTSVSARVLLRGSTSNTTFGKVHNDLDATGSPGAGRAIGRCPRSQLLWRYHRASLGREPDPSPPACDVSNLRLAVQVAGLRKSFGDKLVLDGIDLEIAEGTVFALLGPNGAGKTTTVQILSTLIRADAGDIRVAGFDVNREPDRVRDAIGVTGQFSSVDYLLSGRENLLLMADLHHLDRRRGSPSRRGDARAIRPGRRCRARWS